MAHNETDDHLTLVLRKIKEHGGIAAVAILTELSRRTLYRHAEDAAGGGGKGPPVMGPDTRRELLLLFDKHGLLDDPGELAYARAVATMNADPKVRSHASNPAEVAGHEVAAAREEIPP